MTTGYLIRLTTISLLLIATCGWQQTYAQTLIAQKSGIISFFSSTPVEDIKAENTSFSSSISPATQQPSLPQVSFSLLSVTGLVMSEADSTICLDSILIRADTNFSFYSAIQRGCSKRQF